MPFFCNLRKSIRERPSGRCNIPSARAGRTSVPELGAIPNASTPNMPRINRAYPIRFLVRVRAYARWTERAVFCRMPLGSVYWVKYIQHRKRCCLLQATTLRTAIFRPSSKIDPRRPIMGRILGALPPNTYSRACCNGFGSEFLVFCWMPFFRQFWKRLAQGVLDPIALLASGLVPHAGVNRRLPFVFMRGKASPPNALIAMGTNLPWVDSFISTRIPFFRNCWTSGGKRIFGKHLQTGAIRTTVSFDGAASDLS